MPAARKQVEGEKIDLNGNVEQTKHACITMPFETESEEMEFGANDGARPCESSP